MLFKNIDPRADSLTGGTSVPKVFGDSDGDGGVGGGGGEVRCSDTSLSLRRGVFASSQSTSSHLIIIDEGFIF
jgi:hypothetical protein